MAVERGDRICSHCRYSLNEDFGYSNYTVEGVTISCLLKLNPQLPEDSWYEEEPALKFAETCARYVYDPDPTSIDVDREMGDLENYAKDPEIKELLRAWKKD